MNQIISLLKKLVSIKSLSTEEDEIIKFILEWLKENKIESQQVGKNVVAKILGQDSSKAIIFDGHVDTVSPGELKNWKTDPLVPTIIDDKLYGLGTSDMKGGVAAIMEMAKSLIKDKPPIDVWLALVVKEELDGSGSKEFVEWFVKNTDYEKVTAIIGDTTGIDKLEIGHKGNAFVKINFEGQSGHGSRPEMVSKQAILEANKFISKIGEIVDEWQIKYSDKYLGDPSVAVTGISSGDSGSPNKIPANCTVQLDIRTTPLLHDNLKKEVESWNLDYSYIAKPAPYGWCEANEQIVKIIKKIEPKAELTCSKAATDQCFFSQNGIPAVIYGPGEKGVIHQENEWVNINEVEKFVEIYKQIINLTEVDL